MQGDINEPRCKSCGRPGCENPKCGDNSGGKGHKNMFRAAIGLGLGLMMISYVISVKSDLFRAQVVDGVITGEEVLVIDDALTGGGLFDAADGVATGEGLFAADGVLTDGGLFPSVGLVTDEGVFALAPPITEEEVFEDDFIIVPPSSPAVPTSPIVPAPIFEIPPVEEPLAVAIPDELLAAPVEQELIETGLNAYLLILLIGMIAWVGSIVFKKEATVEILNDLLKN